MGEVGWVAGLRGEGIGERRASKAREDRMREDRARGKGPSPSRPLFDFLPPSLRPATQAMREEAQGSDTNQTGELDQESGLKPETDETDSMGEIHQGCDFDEENGKTDPTGDTTSYRPLNRSMSP